MAVNLSKGQKISLKKDNGSELKRVMVGLGWDEAPQKTGFFGLFSSKPATIDCDASCILLNREGRLIKRNSNDTVVFFGNLRHVSGAIIHQGDNLTGAGEGDDEQIMVDLPRIPAEIDKLVFVVNIYDADKKNQHFGMIRNAFIRIVDLDSNKELCRFDLTEDYSGMQGMIAGEIYRHNGEWKFNAVGQPVRSASRLSALMRLYE